jgi:hypothetical protein
MTPEEIADYLEVNEYPMNSVNDFSTSTMTLITSIKGGYLYNAVFLEIVHKELWGTEITKKDLDKAIAFRKSQWKK